MLVLVCYDVNTESPEGRTRLRRMAKQCENWGQRVQFSVFECLLEPAQWTNLKASLLEIMDENRDSLRFYFLGANWRRRVEFAGLKKSFDPEEALIL
ncbi:MAG: CRISPR-associated endonuclease Cas2 [Desulfovibrio sp.]|jgi:CRISPR-associated protein Cas2|nr:CRISPR-associated endonuclease Cas2 [Desulfovibrio sp.]